MIRRIYKLISVILINSLILSNCCLVCSAKDFTTGEIVGVAIGTSVASASVVGTATAGTIGVMSGAAATSISRNALGNVVLGENNSASKIAKDALTSAAVSGTISVAGYGLSAAYSYLHSNQSTSTITQNAGYVNPDGTGSRLGQEMADAATNSRSGGCLKESVGSSVTNVIKDKADFYVAPNKDVYQYNVIYPKDDGALGPWETTKLQPGTIIDRYGDPTGKFLAPVNTPIEKRALPPWTDFNNYHQYEVLQEFDVSSSVIAPYYEQPGGGI